MNFPTSRRSFLQRSLLLGSAAMTSAMLPGSPALAASDATPSFLDILRPPDSITAFQRFEKTVPAGALPLARSGDTWNHPLVTVASRSANSRVSFTLHAPTAALVLLHMRWNFPVNPATLVLGDAWERSYGELGWRPLSPERVLPWYFATHDGRICNSYGVATGPAALCFWQIDQHGVSLSLNIANGGDGVLLGQRPLPLATIVTRPGQPGEDPVSAVTDLCRRMCSRPSRPLQPIYGANDWNYSYGNSTAESILRDTEFMVRLAPSGTVRPFSVIDGGWVDHTPAWPDMGRLAAAIKKHSVRPGIWIRPLLAPDSTSRNLLVSDKRFGSKKERVSELAYDPTIPEARDAIRAKILQLAGWGYELIKHDFSTYDLLGQWGFEMGPQPTLPGWSLHDRTRTNAEIITDLYSLIREAAGDKTLINGCNTVGHLGQGNFDIQRTGDDTSGRQWERTRRMGVNTAAFRLPQHGTFFCLDADLVGITEAIPWELNRQWLDMLARSGTSTIVAPGPPAHGAEQQSAIREAFQLAARGGAAASPTDWLDTTCPSQWRSKTGPATYNWIGPDGASAFLGG